jgi:biotin carboxyl carrier protein
MYKAIIEEKSFDVEIDGESISVNGAPVSWDVTKINDHHFHILRNHISYNVEILSQNDQVVILQINGHKVEVQTKDKLDLLLEKLGMDKIHDEKLNDLKAPMPGLILKIEAEVGQEVVKGDTLMILEAMKMENVIKAAGEGTVKAIKVKQGDTVEKNQVMIQF